MDQITFEDCGVKLVDVPPFDKSMLKGIKGLSEITHRLPKYRVIFKRPVFGGWTEKVCIYVGYWHSLDGWNYEQKQIKSYQEVEYKTGERYRWKTENM